MSNERNAYTVYQKCTHCVNFTYNRKIFVQTDDIFKFRNGREQFTERKLTMIYIFKLERFRTCQWETRYVKNTGIS